MMELNPDYEYVDYFITFIFCRIFITNFQKFLFYSVHVREPGEESSRVQMDNRRIHSVERDDRGNDRGNDKILIVS